MLAMAVTSRRRVLVVGMHHDDHVSARGQGLAIAGLLVASVAIVLVMHKELQSQSLGNFHGAVGAVIVHQNADVHQFGQFRDGRCQGLLRVIRGQHDGDTFPVDHE